MPFVPQHVFMGRKAIATIQTGILILCYSASFGVNGFIIFKKSVCGVYLFHKLYVMTQEQHSIKSTQSEATWNPRRHVKGETFSPHDSSNTCIDYVMLVPRVAQTIQRKLLYSTSSKRRGYSWLTCECCTPTVLELRWVCNNLRSFST